MRLIDADALTENLEAFMADSWNKKLCIPLPDVVEGCIDFVERQPTVDRWIPCSERMPEDFQVVNIVWVNHNPESYYMHIKDKPNVATGVFYKGKWYWWSCWCVDYLKEYGSRYDTDLVDSDIEITHWMPLPEMPKGEEEE